jgi:broad specificity phosphatase PhoE
VQAALRICLVRHGETAWSLSGQHTGRTELPLTAHGKTTARALRPALKALAPTLVLSSTRLRAVATCELAGQGARIQTTEELAEWDYGDYEGLHTADIHQRHAGWDIWRDGCPGGERPADVQARADPLITRLYRHRGSILLFSHGQFGRALAARWTGLPVAQGKRLAMDEASIGLLGFDDAHPRRRVILRWNMPPAAPPPLTRQGRGADSS